jgi:hypothetical protein
MAVTITSGVDVLKDLGFFEVVFPFILFSAATFGVLQKIKIFGERESLNAIIAIMISLILISFSPAVKLISLVLVYATLLFSVVLFLVLIFQFMGLSMDDIAYAAKQSESTVAIFAALVILMIIAVVTAIPEIQQATEPGALTLEEVGQTGLQEGQVLSDFSTGGTPIQRGLATIYDPSILSVIVMLLMFSGAALLIGRPGIER